MDIMVAKARLAEVADLRKKFLAEIDAQFILDKAHLYNWADTYLFSLDGSKAGYGSVWGKNKRTDRDTIFEFYLEANNRPQSNLFFESFMAKSAVTFIESQTNDPHLAPMLFEYAVDISAESILFEDDRDLSFTIDGAKLEPKENPEAHSFDKQYVLKYDGEMVASGGLMLNYNFPYADIYYGVEESHRRRGFGSFIVQELKTEAYRMGRVPAARCNIDNTISKRTMIKAGMKPCGWRLGGKIKKQS
jgi:RimJ/RimL family protein N-acetyltransferase